MLVSSPPRSASPRSTTTGRCGSEKPIPIQLDFTLRRFAEMAEADPQLRDQQPYKASYEQDMGWLGQAMVKHYQGDDATSVC